MKLLPGLFGLVASMFLVTATVTARASVPNTAPSLSESGISVSKSVPTASLGDASATTSALAVVVPPVASVLPLPVGLSPTPYDGGRGIQLPLETSSGIHGFLLLHASEGQFVTSDAGLSFERQGGASTDIFVRYGLDGVPAEGETFFPSKSASVKPCEILLERSRSILPDAPFVWEDILTWEGTSAEPFSALATGMGTSSDRLRWVSNQSLLPEGYTPTLVHIADPASMTSGMTEAFNPEAAQAFARMTAAAWREDVKGLRFGNSYRSETAQKEMMQHYLMRFRTKASVADATAMAKLRVALPDGSEHRTGLAFDIDSPLADDLDFANTPLYAWLQRNAWKYGMVIRYGEDKTAWTGIQFEPWHLRYLGAPIAGYLSHNGLCYEELLEELKQKGALLMTPEQTGGQDTWWVQLARPDARSNGLEGGTWTRIFPVNADLSLILIPLSGTVDPDPTLPCPPG